MKRILPLLSIVLLASCNVGLKTVTVTMPLFDYEKETIYTQQFQMTIPTGFKELIERSVDADKTHLYYYLPDSSLIYITNTGTLHPNLHNIKALGDSIYEFRFQYKELWKSINEALGEEVLKVLPDTLELSGIDADSFYWKDIIFDELSIGYLRVPPRKKKKFDRCLETFTKGEIYYYQPKRYD